jgi:hypothetical protein
MTRMLFVSQGAPAPIGAPASIFTNQPTGGGWTTVTDLRWNEGATGPLPMWNDPTYEGVTDYNLCDYRDGVPGSGPLDAYQTVVADAGTPGGYGRRLRMTQHTNWPGGGSDVHVARHPSVSGDPVGPLRFPNTYGTGEVYAGIAFRFSAGWTLNGNVSQKLLWGRSTESSINHVVVNFKVGSVTDRLLIAYEPQNPTNAYEMPDTAANNMNDGAWHVAEVLQTPNTGSNADGTLKLWRDTSLQLDITNAQFFTSGQSRVQNEWSVLPVYGGGLNQPPAEQWIDVGPILIKVR